MRNASKAPVLFLVVACCLAGCQQQPSYPTAVEVYFSPQGGCTEAVVKEIDAAKKTLLVQAYSFTSTSNCASHINGFSE